VKDVEMNVKLVMGFHVMILTHQNLYTENYKRLEEKINKKNQIKIKNQKESLKKYKITLKCILISRKILTI